MRCLVLCLLALAAKTCGAADATDSAVTDEEHGKEQITWLLHDRPQLQPIVLPGSPVWNYLQDGFTYSINGEHIFWDPTSTSAVDESGALTQFMRSHMIFIRADRTYKEGEAAGRDISGEAMLRHVVFELNNAKRRDEFNAVAAKAERGELTRRQFILAVAAVEFGTSQATRLFWNNVWRPYCRREHLQSNDELWANVDYGNFDDWMRQFPEGSWYPWQIYGLDYDRLMKRPAAP